MQKAPGNPNSKAFRPIDVRAGFRFEAEVPYERRQFRELILTNPNYFGTVPNSAFKAVQMMASNTAYEEIACIGYNPDTEELSAIVNLKKPGGYLTALCGTGSPEYVRFYLFDQATSRWVDQGVSSFNAHNMGHTDSLSYSVTLKISPKRNICSEPNLWRVKAILSWNDMPDANTPSFTPVWGQVKEVTIQSKPRTKVFQGVVDALSTSIASDAVLEADAVNAAALYPISALPIAKWKEMLQKKPLASRAAASIKAHVLANPQKAKSLMTKLQAISPDLMEILAGLQAAQGNTQYEELTCVGYNQGVSQLAATVVVKQSQGYLQGLCYSGSRENVAFWVDWNDGTGWTYAGTSFVRVHDISGATESGIHYAVTLPLNAATHTAPCVQGPQIYRVRAVLSWETLPSQTDPNWVPYWGNVEEAEIQVKPGPSISETEHVPIITTVGGMLTTSINAQGLADGPSAKSGIEADQSPFGGLVIISGHIANPPSLAEPPLKYRIMVSDDAGLNWHPLNNKFSIGVTQWTGSDWIGPSWKSQVPDDMGWYTYQAAEPYQFVEGDNLAYWYTSPHEGKWQIRMDVLEPDGTVVYGDDTVTVLLDNTAPNVALTLESTGGPCGAYESGTEITATYSVSDDHLHSIALHVDPHQLTTTMAATFSTDTVFPFINTSANGTVTVTGLVDACGYALRLEAVDRTIVNSGSFGFRNHAAVGICVRNKQQ